METGLVRASETRLPKFVEDAYNSIEGMKQFANILLESKLVPDSYYEKGPDNKPDYNKGKTSAVVVVLLQAQQLNVPPMTALQHIVPVNGLLSVKGDLAKTMIFASGKLKKDSWKETTTGSIETGDMVFTITATRDDNGISITRSFSIEKAKRMGLWITDAKVSGQDGWKYKLSAWYKTPDRMIMYRALGNLARDLFSDVLLNMYTTEEAQDIGRETAEIIETPDGNKITIPDKEHAKERAEKATSRVANKIKSEGFKPIQTDIVIPEAQVVNEPAETKETEQEKEKDSFTPERGSVEVLKGEVIRENDVPVEEKINTALEEMNTKSLLEIINADMNMMEAMELIPGKNTNKKLREIVSAFNAGNLAEYVAEHMPKEEPAPETASGDIKPNKDFDNFLDDRPGQQAPEEATTAPPSNDDSFVNTRYGLTIPGFDKPEGRDFSTTKTLFNKLAGLTPPLTSARYTEIATKKGVEAVFPDKEVLCKKATAKFISEILDMV